MHRFMTLASLCLCLSSFAFAGQAPSDVKEWTLLVYMNGNNNLDTYGPMDINEMETVGSTDKINVVVQYASLANGTKRYFVQKDNDPNTVTSPVVQDMGASVDMGSVNTLNDFIAWGVKNYPAKHYFIDVWNHGAGWHLKNQMRLASKGRGVHIDDISWDDKTNNHITTEQLGQSINLAAKVIGHKVDIYGSDACLMAMAEVADEMADSVDVYVGSEETEPMKGWPYDALLSGWTALSDMKASEIAKILTTEYVKSYQGGSQGTEQGTFSAFDMSKIHDLNQQVKAFGDTLRRLDKAAQAKLMTAAGGAQRFAYFDYVDLVDFLDKAQAADAGVRDSDTRALREVVSQFVIANAATSNYAGAHGLSIWMPTDSYSYSSYSARYNALHFNADTGWGETLQALVGSTPTNQ